MSLKPLSKLLFVASLAITLPSCAFVDWLVYKQDLPQGNFLEQKDIDKLRIEMSKEQVAYLIGRPVVDDTFGGDTWRYVYHFKSGRNAEITYRELILTFKGNKLVTAAGDYKVSEDFNTPIEK
ncbi:outer membrane protein assembly factor BamE [Psychrobium sp. 1_MG-2023]|uniref:outer membrane protein assembly factor BamE n=1 Tax=Psychrobium sp. 1_MG-2023 TaxID=3062624 RepID=UPI000C323728|nr:outer membrane protein assembly factor BamE [Psychrobium sp. 1_MG-2023]MDP2561274.1 outer membrane protein assembly factor BamE [Psychrobium sp. 1_MG-2023]PKF55226.1 outer membrane protein assembly factor BamE [Alteromonadales bacterium alter-6D02]